MSGEIPAQPGWPPVQTVALVEGYDNPMLAREAAEHVLGYVGGHNFANHTMAATNLARLLGSTQEGADANMSPYEAALLEGLAIGILNRVEAVRAARAAGSTATGEAINGQ